MRLSDLQNKDIINTNDGKKIGNIIDVNITDDGKMLGFIVEQGKFFSKFSSRDEIEVKWSQIKKIGEDVILVSVDFLWYYFVGDDMKISINMLSSADKVDGQGVGSAYLEQVNLIREGADDLFDVYINSRKKCDIVHVHTVDLWNYFKMKKGISVCYVHFLPDTLDGSIRLPKFAFNVFKKYVTKFYNRADYLVVVNPIFIKDLVRFGIDESKISYIPNYVSKDNFYKKSNDEVLKIRDKYNIDENAFVVLGVGQVQTRKGVMDFIDVAKKMPDVTFVWCGGFSFGVITDGYDELKRIYENPPSNVIFTGILKREDMNDMYNMADVLFMPSYNELFPMSILEAVNSEKPLVLRNLDLYEDILFNKYLVGTNNDEFVLRLKELKSDKKLYNKYSKYSHEISSFYSKEHVLQIWKDFYLKIVNKK